jgi:hypothetical protein
MNVAFIPIAELDGKEAERKSFGDKQFDLKIMSHAKSGGRQATPVCNSGHGRYQQCQGGMRLSF